MGNCTAHEKPTYRQFEAWGVGIINGGQYRIAYRLHHPNGGEFPACIAVYAASDNSNDYEGKLYEIAFLPNCDVTNGVSFDIILKTPIMCRNRAFKTVPFRVSYVV